jgi:hypothetical protein
MTNGEFINTPHRSAAPALDRKETLLSVAMNDLQIVA